MLLSLSVQNFRSFGDEAILDLQRRSFKTNRPRAGETWAENTWRRGAIFGANAAGKSNILRTLNQLGNAVRFSLTNDKLTKSLHDPHKRRLADPTSFELEFVSHDIRFRWGLTLDRDGIVEEYLDANPQSRWRQVFTRTRNDIEFGATSGLSQASKQNIAEFMRPWALTLSAWATIKNPGDYVAALSWWGSLLPLISADESDQETRHKWLIDLAKKDPNWLNVLGTVISLADVGVDSIGIKEKAPERLRQLVLEVKADGQAFLNKATDEDTVTEILHYILFTHGSDDGSFSLPEEEESQGTRMWMDLVGPAMLALAVGGVLIVDEIDGSLHPMLVRELVSYFDDHRLNPLGAQLLFSTHDITLLGKHPVEVLDRGEVWFVDKQNSFSSLFALDEYTVREAHNVEKRYLQGSFGAVPIANRTELEMTLNKLRDTYALDEAVG